MKCLGTRWTTRALMVACATTVTGCSGPARAPEATPAPAATAPPIAVVRVVAQPLDITLEMPGELQPDEMVAIYPRVTGFLKTVRVDRGSRVRRGDALATLEAPELVAQRAEAQSKVQSAQAQLNATRAKAAADRSTYDNLRAAAATPGVVAGNDLVVAQKRVETEDSEVTAAEQNVEAARQALMSISELERYLVITAPFDGVVTERNVHPGALVGPNSGGPSSSPLFRVVKQDRLRLVVPVPQAYIAGLKTGTAVPFTIQAYPGEMFSGKIARIAQAVDPATRTMAVELDVMNTDGRLTPGIFCQVRWPVQRPVPSLFVPSGAVASTTGRTFVVRVRNDRAEWVDVRTGLSAGALVEVFGDLQAGDQVAVRGTDQIRPGTEVQPKEVKSPA